MRPMAEGLLSVLLAGCFVAIVAVAGEQEGSEHSCAGPFENYTLSPEDLIIVLGNHLRWLESGSAPGNGGKANLCQANLERANLNEANLEGADLDEANLQGAYLPRANLQGAYLPRANLQGANLEGANLEGAYLYRANLQRVVLEGANLQRANLEGANLEGADLPRGNLQRAILWEANLQGIVLREAGLQRAYLYRANLQGANLEGANLEGADLREVNLEGADLDEANLQAAIYEPKPEKLPTLWSLTSPYNHLEKMVFRRSPAALIALREAFKKGGMRAQERQLTYAIEHTKQLEAWDPSWCNPEGKDPRPLLEQLSGKSESLFRYVLFELPSGYGMVPSRALATLGFLIVVFSLVYMVAFLTARGRAGMWVTWPTDRIYQEEGAKEATRVTNTFFFPQLQARAVGHWWGVLLRGVSVPLISLYFSILSAFSLGWRELNVGTWISRMQPREYVLRATGWVRFVSGFQSLLSVYLLALWVLTYFGRPFE